MPDQGNALDEFLNPKSMITPGIAGALTTLLTATLESGLDAERFFELVQSREIKDALIANTERSVARGTFGAPTFFVGDEIFFGKDRLRDVEERIVECSETIARSPRYPTPSA